MGANQQMLFGMSSGSSAYLIDGAKFTASSTYLSRSSNLTGAANSKTGIISFWVAGIPATGSNSGPVFYQQSNTNTSASPISWNAARFSGNWNPGNYNGQLVGTGVAFQLVDGTGNITSGLTWHHMAASWDTSTGDFSKSSIWFDGVNRLQSVNSTINNQTVGYTDFKSMAINATMTGAGPTASPNSYDVWLADVYFAPGQWLDLTVAANLQKFYNSGKPVFLGATGSLPTGSVPAFFLHLDRGEAAANFATNRAGNGNFTVNGTALSTASTAPPDG